MWPESAGGWWAIGLAAVGLASWVVLPIVTLILRTRYPVTDTRIMPVIGAVMVGVAAAVNVLCLWQWIGPRSTWSPRPSRCSRPWARP